VRTNLDAGHLKLTWISWAAKHDPRGVTNRFLQINARLLKPLSPDQSKIDPRNKDSEPFIGAFLKDSHGCFFEGGDFALRHFKFEFSLPPPGETNFTLDFYHEPDGSSSLVKLASFDLRNLWPQPALSFTPGPFPVVSKSEAVDVSLHRLPNAQVPNLNRPRDPDSGAEQILDTFSFAKNSQPAPGWKHISGRFFDRWGNSDNDSSSFCREEESFIQANFDRDFATATFEPHEKINIPIDTVPHPGERKVVNSEHPKRPHRNLEEEIEESSK
jgi:hypothetical protein